MSKDQKYKDNEVGVIGGKENREIVVVEYDADWSSRFEQERDRVKTALGEKALAIEHVGSTSVPGLAAKPIIDICLAVQDSSDEDSYLPDLLAAGYLLRVREHDWHEHRMFRTPKLDVHLHVFTVGDSEIEKYLMLRDWLRSNKEDCDLYGSTKRNLTKQNWKTMNDYADAKTKVISEIMKRAQVAYRKKR